MNNTKDETVYEYCNHCEWEVPLPLELGTYNCPNCGLKIINCTMCNNGKCDSCDLSKRAELTNEILEKYLNEVFDKPVNKK